MPNLWFDVHEILSLNGFDTIVFVDQIYKEKGLALHVNDKSTGPWTAATPDSVSDLLNEFGVSNSAHFMANQIDIGLTEKVEERGHDFALFGPSKVSSNKRTTIVTEGVQG